MTELVTPVSIDGRPSGVLVDENFGLYVLRDGEGLRLQLSPERAVELAACLRLMAANATEPPKAPDLPDGIFVHEVGHA